MPKLHGALALSEADLDRRRGSVLVRRGKGGRHARTPRFLTRRWPAKRSPQGHQA